MTRLIDLEGQRRVEMSLSIDDSDRLLMRARQAQARYVAELSRGTVAVVGRVTGLAALVDALRRHTAYRRTLDELTQLDDGVLADIGLSRSEIRRRALECSQEAVPARRRWWNRLGAWVARVRDEQRAHHELSMLDPRLLRDIGIEPGSLRGDVERMTRSGSPAVVEAVSALREAVVVLFAPAEPPRGQRSVATAETAPAAAGGKRAA